MLLSLLQHYGVQRERRAISRQLIIRAALLLQEFQHESAFKSVLLTRNKRFRAYNLARV